MLTPPPVAEGPAKLLVEAKRLKAEGKLTEDMLVDALVGGRPALVLAGLSVLSGLPLTVIEKILSAHSAKGVTALILEVEAADALRRAGPGRAGAAAPRSETLKPRADGGFPLSEEALEWQIGFFTDMAAESSGGVISLR